MYKGERKKTFMLYVLVVLKLNLKVLMYILLKVYIAGILVCIHITLQTTSGAGQTC